MHTGDLQQMQQLARQAGNLQDKSNNRTIICASVNRISNTEQARQV
jgi:hypothetical protein